MTVDMAAMVTKSVCRKLRVLNRSIGMYDSIGAAK